MARAGVPPLAATADVAGVAVEKVDAITVAADVPKDAGVTPGAAGIPAAPASRSAPGGVGETTGIQPSGATAATGCASYDLLTPRGANDDGNGQ